MLDSYFAMDMPLWRFSLNTLAVSCLGIVPLLLIYVSLTPGFGPMLLGGGLALTLFLRQVVTNGLLVVFAVNFLCFFLYAATRERHGPETYPVWNLLLDPPLRTLVFLVFNALVYILSARWFGSFGGDPWLALRSVAPTLERSASLAGLSGVYLYATLASALPVYTRVISRLLARDAAHRTWSAPLARILPDRSSALLLSLALFAVFPALVTLISTLIASAQTA